MRLFVAVTVAEEMIAAAQDAARAIEERLPSGINVRWVSASNMHLTVRFIGHVNVDRAPAVLDALRPPLPVPPFTVELGTCGVFPPSGAPRVIWIGLKQGLSSLQSIHEEFDRRLTPLGFAAETRSFNVHLTLARIKDTPRTAATAVRDAVAAVRPRIARSPISAATVFESRLSPKGAVYQRLFDVPCTV